MRIVTPDQEQETRLALFRKTEWEGPDREHFGDADVDFGKESFTLMAEEDGQVAGYVQATLDMGALYIDGILTGEAFRKRGVGTLLMRAAEERGREMGAHKVWLETGADWDARKLYDSLGYACVASLKRHYAQKDYVIYEKFL